MSWGNLSQQIKLTDISKGHGPIFPYTFSIVAPVACLARGRSLACPPGDKSRWSSNFKIALIPSTPSKLWYYYFFFLSIFRPLRMLLQESNSVEGPAAPAQTTIDLSTAVARSLLTS